MSYLVTNPKDRFSHDEAHMYVVMIFSFWGDMSGKIVKTQIRQPLKEQSNQDLHCLPFLLHLLDSLLYIQTPDLKF